MNGAKRGAVLALAAVAVVAGIGIFRAANRPEPSPEPRVTEPMTGTETLAFYADRYGTDTEEARRFLGGQVEAFPDDATVVVSVPLETTGNYTPCLDLYCQVDGEGADWEIVSVYSVQLRREAGGKGRPFAGNVSVYLRGGREIEYIINGDFFRKGTMEADLSGRVDIGPDGSAGVAFAISDGDPGEKGIYCYQNGTVKV